MLLIHLINKVKLIKTFIQFHLQKKKRLILNIQKSKQRNNIIITNETHFVDHFVQNAREVL